MKQVPNKDVIMRFYRLMSNVDYSKLDDEKIKELEAAVERWRYFFVNQSIGLVSMMTFTAEKMITSNGRYTAITPEEKMYFYVKMIDPDFYFLEAHESGNTIDEIKQLCFLNFRIYDPTLIKHELAICKVLNRDPDDMWSLDRIKR